MNSNPHSWVIPLSLSKPTIHDNTADTDRILAHLKKKLDTTTIEVDYHLLQELPERIRAYGYQCKCIIFQNLENWTLLDITERERTRPLTATAVDLGTTRIVMRLIDLESGATLQEVSFDNPQIAIGPDILTRIHHADTREGLAGLSRMVIDKLNQSMEEMCRSCDLQPQDIYLMTVAGNTTMTHLFLGLPARFIIREPYIPVINTPGTLAAEKLGLTTHPSGRIFVFPNVGSYFGGDLIAGILYSGIHTNESTAILVDVGTNAEVVIGNNSWLVACAGAAGPALEGGVTKIGMMAGPGVIDRIRIDPTTKEIGFHTIEERAPIGICGSGIIDLAAQLFLSGLIDIRGKLNPAVAGERIRQSEHGPALIVAPAQVSGTGRDLIIHQADLDSLTRSKAAMYTILETISMYVGIDLKDLERFYIAGTFGSYIDPHSAISIGMMPDLPIARYQVLGNSSLEGATLLLTNRSVFNSIESIQNRITYMELNVNQDFMNRFSAAKFYPHTTPSLFPSVPVP